MNGMDQEGWVHSFAHCGRKQPMGSLLARFAGKCGCCGSPVEIGDRIYRLEGADMLKGWIQAWVCEACGR